MATLQICIPTYNRSETLVENVRRLQSFQSELDFKILVVDNATESFSNAQILDSLKSEGTTVVRNPCNVGGQANVLKCYELSDADYVWVVGDDDFLDLDGIRTVLNELSLDSETDVFNFRCDAPHHPKVRTEYSGITRSEFIRSIGTLGALYYVVGYVFKRASVLPYLKSAYINLNYFCPHLALVMNASGLRYKSTNACVHTWHEVSSKDNSLSPVPLLMNVPLILQNVSNFQELRLLRSYLREAKKHFIFPLKLPFSLVQAGIVDRSTAFWITRRYWVNNERQVPTVIGMIAMLFLLVYCLAPSLVNALSKKLIGVLKRFISIPDYVMSDKRI